ncbi:MAG: hypothetical protein GC203_04425 [Phenylobacterium sp.]|uniref:hypothetical protein n=1 Tax=Phenylobacterium sp. TaxID=1871053 RepID=UPI0025E475E7|nr:hypothetical protein [Phenylobacterium sp.]MBI1197089.1 hypothetical protein [Phenylobacterium sp.]
MPFSAWLLFASLAAAADPPAQPHEVQGVVVAPVTEPPRLVGSFPAAGQAVAPGVLVLKLTFDQKMLETGFDLAPAAGGDAPDCLKTPRLLNDAKTFVLLCTTKPGHSYSIALNAAPAPDRGFANIGHTRAAPATLAFTTTSADPVRKLEDAMKTASLDPRMDNPIETAPEN